MFKKLAEQKNNTKLIPFVHTVYFQFPVDPDICMFIVRLVFFFLDALLSIFLLKCTHIGKEPMNYITLQSEF